MKKCVTWSIWRKQGLREKKKGNKWVSWHLKGGKWGGKNKKNVQSFRLPNINSKENNVSMATTTECTMDTGGKNSELWRGRGAGCEWNEQVVPQGQTCLSFSLKNEDVLHVGSGLGLFLCCVSAVCWGPVEPASIIRHHGSWEPGNRIKLHYFKEL